MLQTLKWTESFFMGLAIVLIALAVIAVPSNHVWGDPPGDPGVEVVGCKGAENANNYCNDQCFPGQASGCWDGVHYDKAGTCRNIIECSTCKCAAFLKDGISTCFCW